MVSAADRQRHLSQDLVALLRDKFGETYSGIAGRLKLSESYICRVANGTRSLRFEHLFRMEDAYRIPLPVLIILAWKDEHIPEEMRDFYRPMRALIEFFESLYGKQDS